MWSQHMLHSHLNETPQCQVKRSSCVSGNEKDQEHGKKDNSKQRQKLDTLTTGVLQHAPRDHVTAKSMVSFCVILVKRQTENCEI